MLSLRPENGPMRQPLERARSTIRAFSQLSILLLATLLMACPSYTDEVADAHRSVIHGDADSAVSLINGQLDVDSIQEVPDKIEKNNTLLLLERATIMQGQGRFDLSARDMMIVDQRLEWLDIDRAAARDVGKYLYSDDVTNYKAPPYERLLLNTLNMINFLATHDLESARVEARRFLIMESFYLDDQGKALLPGLLALGSYLAGATFEASREYDEAARHYSRAWLYGIRDENLRVRLLDLYRISGYSGAGVDSPFFVRLREDARAAGPMTWDEYRDKHQRGDTLVIAQFGVVPYKQATRVGANQALTIASTRSMDPSTRAQATSMVASGALNSINFPQLTRQGLPMRDGGSAAVRIDDQRIGLFEGMDVGRSVEIAWLEIAGLLMVVVIMCVIMCAALGQGTRAAGAAAAQSDNSTTATLGVLGWLVGLGAEAALSAADTPDTRSWTTLPEHIRLSRIKLPQGMHTAEIRVGSRTDRQTVPVWEDKLNIINFSKVR